MASWHKGRREGQPTTRGRTNCYDIELKVIPKRGIEERGGGWGETGNTYQ